MGFTTSFSYPLHRSFKRVGMTYSFDRSSLLALSTASKNLFEFLAFRGISGPNALSGIITSKIFPNFSFNTLDSAISPHHGHQMTLGAEIAGIGGTVRSVRPIVQYKQFIPVQKRRNAIRRSTSRARSSAVLEGWSRRRSSASTWAAKTTFAVLTSARCLRSRFCPVRLHHADQSRRDNRSRKIRQSASWEP